MKVISIEKLESIDFCLKDVIKIQQNWLEGISFNALRSPKKNQCFLYLYGTCVEYQLADGTVFQAKEGDCVYAPKGSKYKARFFNKTKPISTILINFNLTINDVYFNLFDNVHVLSQKKDCDFGAAFEDFISDGMIPSLILKSKVLKLFEFLRKNQAEDVRLEDSEYSVIMPAIQYMKEHENDNVSVEKLAEICYVSTDLFRKKFRAIYGVSPKEFFLNKRLLKAKKYLESHEFSVTAISYMFGFSSPTYFCKIFKKKFGYAPGGLIKNK